MKPTLMIVDRMEQSNIASNLPSPLNRSTNPSLLRLNSTINPKKFATRWRVWYQIYAAAGDTSTDDDSTIK